MNEEIRETPFYGDSELTEEEQTENMEGLV